VRAPRRSTLKAIAPTASLDLIPLPGFDSPEGRLAFGANSEAAMFVGELLQEEVPGLSGKAASFEIVAIARRPGVLSKVAIRPRSGALTPLVVGIGADHLARISQQLDGERIQVVRWQRSASGYIADALGLGEIPPVVLLPALGRARVLLGEIDMRGIAGWRGLNVILASALTGWRIRLELVSATAAWTELESAMRARRAVTGRVVGRTERGPRLELLGLFGVLSGGGGAELMVGQDIEVRISRMDADEGRISASDRLATRAQLQLL
jgi:transcription antitermination factor NusA-like protein